MAAMTRRGPLIAGGIAIVLAGGGALGFGLTRDATGGMSHQESAAVATAIGQLDGDIKAARATAHERATSIANMDTAQAAVATNYKTVQEIASTSLAFHPAAGEVIELGQMVPGSGAVVLLVEPPEDQPDSEAFCQATQTERGKPGSYLELLGTRLIVTAVADVMPKASDRPGLTGYVIVSRPLELAPALGLLGLGRRRRADRGRGHERAVRQARAGLGLDRDAAAVRSPTCRS